MWVHFQAGILLSLVLISFGFPKIEKFDFKHFRSGSIYHIPEKLQFLDPMNAKLGRIRDFRQFQAHLPVVVMQKLKEHQVVFWEVALKSDPKVFYFLKKLYST